MSYLRWASTSRLVVPPIKLSTVGSRAFPVAAAHVWNGLSEAVVSSSSLHTFRRQLKTDLFQLLYPHPILWLLNWHRYSGPCSNVCYLGHSKNLCLLTYWTVTVHHKYVIHYSKKNHTQLTTVISSFLSTLRLLIQNVFRSSKWLLKRSLNLTS